MSDTDNDTEINDIDINDAEINNTDQSISRAPPITVITWGNISTTTFEYTGTVQTWTVPLGLSSVTVDAYGASSSINLIGQEELSGLGKGGRVKTTLSVNSGFVLNIYVGGTHYVSRQSGNNTPGWNGGGNGGQLGWAAHAAVSYTHLTLPTNREV